MHTQYYTCTLISQSAGYIVRVIAVVTTRRIVSYASLILSCLSAQADFVGYGYFGLNGVQPPDPNVTVLSFPDGLNLTDPIVFEDFEGGTEFQPGSVGWTENNFTDPIAGHAGFIPDDPQSDAYLGWVLLERTRLESIFAANRQEVAPAQVFNNQPVTGLLSGTFLYAESDQRGGNQVQILLSPSYDFTGQRDLVLSFNSAYHQNQDSIGAIEYTTDRGITWHPIVYLIDRDDLVLLGNGTTDAVATFSALHSDVAVYTNPVGGGQIGGSFGAFVSAPITQALAPFISGRVNDDAVESKRVEAFRIPEADEKPDVQFRIVHAGTASWYWGIDNWGIYKTPSSDVVTTSLKRHGDGQNSGVRLSLSVAGRPLSAGIGVVGAALPAPETGSDADRLFGVDLTTASSIDLPSGQVHHLTVEGLDPAKAYDLSLYSDLARGNGVTGVLLKHTLIGATSFRNESSQHPTLSVISGTSDETTTIDITDNSAPNRGFAGQFNRILPGLDGTIRIQLEGTETSCITALKLVETTPQAVAIAAPVAVTETTATVFIEVATEDAQHVYLYWGGIDAGNNAGSWENVVDLGQHAPGSFSHVLDGLETFNKYYYVLHSDGVNGSFWSPVESFRPQTQGLLYATSFEPDEREPFVSGALHGQGLSGMWRVDSGNATVQAATASSGLQAVQAGECIIDVAFTNNSEVLWVDAFFMESGTTNQPVIPTNLVSSVVFFSSTDGILALDGSGDGSGSFVPVVPDYPKDRFVRLTVRNDYLNKRYDVWVDGVLSRAGLGFKDNSVVKLSGAQRRSIRSNYMDDFSVSIWGLDADTDGDGLVDLDEAKFYGSYALLADTDGDGANDGYEVGTRTDPADSNSRFAVAIDVDPELGKIIKIPTVTGLEYTIQRRGTLEAGAWQDVPGASNVPGDGQEKAFLETSDGDNYFYRGVIINR